MRRKRTGFLDKLASFHLEENRRTLLVMGGSQGASGINQILFKCAPLLKDHPLQIIHLTGERDDRLAAANYQREGIPQYVAPFHHRMEDAYSAADLVISRAGAASGAERGGNRPVSVPECHTRSVRSSRRGTRS